MDRLSLTSGVLFVIADAFAIISLIMPDWIVTDVGGNTKLGLMRECLTIYNRSQICISPSLSTEWAVTLLCIFIGCIAITTTIVLLVVSYWEPSVISHAQWMGFLAMVLFCFAAVIFPIGFHIPQIGGEPYQLPNSHQVGVSYVFFVLALWITVISELFVVFPSATTCITHNGIQYFRPELKASFLYIVIVSCLILAPLTEIVLTWALVLIFIIVYYIYSLFYLTYRPNHLERSRCSNGTGMCL